MTRADTIRTALERLIRAYDSNEGMPIAQWIAAARAALTEPVGEGPAVPEGREPTSVAGEPSDQELLQLALDTRIYRFQLTARDPVQYELTEAQFNAFARAVLARWGHQPVPPAEWEVAQLVAWLRAYANGEQAEGRSATGRSLTRAAELLQQQQAKIESLEQQLETERMRVVACGIIATSDTPFSAAKNRNCHPDYWSASADDIARQIDELMRLRAQQTPVPVSEGLPEPEDCDGEGRCWFYTPTSSVLCTYWVLRQPDSLRTWETHWLPAHALPVPQGEVQP